MDMNSTSVLETGMTFTAGGSQGPPAFFWSDRPADSSAGSSSIPPRHIGLKSYSQRIGANGNIRQKRAGAANSTGFSGKTVQLI